LDNEFVWEERVESGKRMALLELGGSTEALNELEGADSEGAMMQAGPRAA
jgi:hypothetical protein